MGRHKVPEIVKLIKNLKSKGESLGFVAHDEFKVLGGLYWVDLIWSYREDHSLFIAFEFENKSNARLLKNLSKIFDTPSSEVEKPYHHFLIVFDGTLSSGMRKIVAEKARRYNIHIFEDFKNNKSEQQRLNTELQQLEIQLSDLIERKGKTNSVGVIHDVLRGLKDVVPVLVIRGHPYSINQSTLTSSAIPIPQRSLSSLTKGTFDTTKYEGFALIPLPRKRFVMIIPNTSISLDAFLMDKKEDDKKIHLSFVACELPFKLDFDFLKGGKGGGFHISIDPDVADVVEVKKFEDIVRVYDKHKKLHIMDINGKVFAGCEGVSFAKPFSCNEWYKGISDLAYIQQATSHRIPCPKDLRISAKDLMVIARTRKIVEKGEEVLPVQTVSFTMVKEHLEKLVETQRNLKKIAKLSVSLKRYSINLLGEELPLGPVTWQLPDMIFREPLEEVMKRISDIETKVPIEASLVPLSNINIRIIYHKWKKQS